LRDEGVFPSAQCGKTKKESPPNSSAPSTFCWCTFLLAFENTAKGVQKEEEKLPMAKVFRHASATSQV